MVRKEIFDSSFSFDGSFQATCQQEAVPPALLALVNMILDGANIEHQTQLVHTTTTKPALAISQLMVFNSVKHARNVDSPSSERHSRSRETPLPLYLSLKIHAVTRSRMLVDTLFNLGLCVSYDRLLQLTSDIANGVCQPGRQVCHLSARWKMSCVHQTCVTDCSQQGLWTTSTTIQVLQQPKIPSTAPESRLYSIRHTQMTKLIMVY